MPVYSETQSIDIQDGYFTAYIGDVNPLGLAVFRDHGTLYLGVRVGTDREMSPRALLGTVPFAGFAQYAAEVPFGGITGVPAGLADGDDDTRYTAGSGLTLMGTTFSVDTGAIQARVTGSCPAGQSIRAIAADGTVTCEVDDSYSDAAARTAVTPLLEQRLCERLGGVWTGSACQEFMRATTAAVPAWSRWAQCMAEFGSAYAPRNPYEALALAKLYSIPNTRYYWLHAGGTEGQSSTQTLWRGCCEASAISVYPTARPVLRSSFSTAGTPATSTRSGAGRTATLCPSSAAAETEALDVDRE
jgi:hypothetical protein